MSVSTVVGNHEYPDDISYRTLRLLLGLLGISLPVILYIGNLWIFHHGDLLGSISKYYYTGMRDVFVGYLFAIGLFLMTYKGYKPKNSDPWYVRMFGDNRASIVAGIMAIGVALFPTINNEDTKRDLVNWIHVIETFILYAILAYMSYFLFTRRNEFTDEKKEGRSKKEVRDIIYKVCGVLIFISILLIFVFNVVEISVWKQVTFWLEVVANTAFGISWLVKGGGIWFLRDVDEEVSREEKTAGVLAIILLVIMAIIGIFVNLV